MSELKDYDIMDIEAMDDDRLEKSESGRIQVTRVYIKSEADKVIKGLKEVAKNLILDNYLKGQEIKHHKYKRCLAMAEVCKHKRWRADVCDEQGYDYARSTNQMNRWLELAEKFKEAK